MSTRKRVKALANLSVKRPTKNDNIVLTSTNTENKSSNETSDEKFEQEQAIKIESQPTNPVNPATPSSDIVKTELNTSNRRRIKAVVNIPSRKSKSTPQQQQQQHISENKTTLKESEIIESTIEENELNKVHENIDSKLDNNDIIPKIGSPKSFTVLEESIKSPNTFNDSQFKSPRNVPATRTIQAAVKSIPKENNLKLAIIPITDYNSLINNDDPLKCPMSPTKIRQRIRPTPFFGNRRNSIQGNNSDVEDEPRRQRHHSTSSSHSNQNNNSTALKTYSNSGLYNNRIRTDSSCSNMSDISLVKDVLNSKQRRGMRSEESYRMVEARREFKNRFSGVTPDKAQLTMYDMIHYNPNSNPMKNPAFKDANERDRRMSANCSVSSFIAKKESRTPTPTLKDEESMPVPQLKIGPNGEIIIDEKSLVIETTGEKEARETLANSDIVYDDEFSGSQGFYKRQQRTKDWRPEETIKFYRCLQITGTDFSMMVELFPNRTRRDLKLKFKKEEKFNSILINKALLRPKTFNIEELQLELKKDEDILIERKKQLEALKLKQAQERKSSLQKLTNQTPQKRISRVQRHLTDGDFVYQNENILQKKKRVKRTITKEETVKKIEDTLENNDNLQNNNNNNNNISVDNNSNLDNNNFQVSFSSDNSQNPNKSDYIPNLDIDFQLNNNVATQFNSSVEKLPSFNNVMPSQNTNFHDFNIYVQNSGEHFVPDNNNSIETIINFTDNNIGANLEIVNELDSSHMMDPKNLSHITLTDSIANNIIDNNNFDFDNAEIIFDTNVLNDDNNTFTLCESNLLLEIENNNVTLKNNKFDDSENVTQSKEIELNHHIIQNDINEFTTLTTDNVTSNITISQNENNIVVNERRENESSSCKEVPHENNIKKENSSQCSSNNSFENIIVNSKTEPPHNQNELNSISSSKLPSVKSDVPINNELNSKEKDIKNNKRKNNELTSKKRKKSRVTKKLTEETKRISIEEIDEIFSDPIERENQGSKEFSTADDDDDVKIKSDEHILDPTEIELSDDQSESNIEIDNLNSLVVVELQDPLNKDKTIYEIYQMCDKTGKMADKPLNLPQSVIDHIASMKPET